jgi:hypothetical protein
MEMFNRATIFVTTLSGTVVALALLARATGFGPETIAFALVLLPVALFIGAATFARSVSVNYEDARLVTGMDLLRHAYLRMVPELEQFFVTGHGAEDQPGPLGYGVRQRLANLRTSLTTTSSVVATLNSVVAGAIASALTGLLHADLAVVLALGAGFSLASAALHVRYAGRFREAHRPPARARYAATSRRNASPCACAGYRQ